MSYGGEFVSSFNQAQALIVGVGNYRHPLFAALAATPAHKLVVVLDACHAAGAVAIKASDGGLSWKNSLPDSYYQALAEGSGRVVIASSRENQYSALRSQGDLSLFTWHMLKGLE